MAALTKPLVIKTPVTRSGIWTFGSTWVILRGDLISGKPTDLLEIQFGAYNHPTPDFFYPTLRPTLKQG